MPQTQSGQGATERGKPKDARARVRFDGRGVLAYARGIVEVPGILIAFASVRRIEPGAPAALVGIPLDNSIAPVVA